MSSVKLTLRKYEQRKDGTCPLAIRIIKDRKPSYIYTGVRLLPKHWNEEKGEVRRSHPNSNRIKALLAKKMSEVYPVVIDADTNNETATTFQIKERITGKKATASFTKFAQQRVQDKWDEGVFSVARAERSILSNIMKFHGKDQLSFQEIDAGFIKRFKVHCKSVLNHSTRTRTNQLIFIRTLYNQAIKEGLVDSKYYPFAGDKEKIKITSGQKIGLTEEEVHRIESLELEPGTSIWHTRNVWLFAFYFAGVRISDVIKMEWRDLRDGRLFYMMDKNEKPVSLKAPDKATTILELYKPGGRSKPKYVFPFLNKDNYEDKRDIHRVTTNAIRLMNKYLKRIALACDIETNLSNHIARHTFGNIAGEQVHPLMLQKLYRHSNLQTTLDYQANFIHKDADDALDKVVSF